jgi:hypothetical protein
MTIYRIGRYGDGEEDGAIANRVRGNRHAVRLQAARSELLQGCHADSAGVLSPISRAGGKRQVQSGLLLDTCEYTMKGTKFGPVIKLGKGLSSPLSQVIEGRVDKSIRMPHGGTPIPEAQIQTLRSWVDQGAKNN